MPTTDRIRIRVISPASALVHECVRRDDWYQTGGHRPPVGQAAARRAMATVELREWLDRADPSPGRYTIAVREDAPDGTEWACVSVDHRMTLDSKKPPSRPKS